MRLRRVEPYVRRALRGSCAVPPGTAVLVAVSGGADSTALLRALHRLAPEFGLRVAAAHLHHRLRGAAADGDLAFVRGLCAGLGVPLVAARWNARARMRRRGLSGQAGLRTLRRQFLRGAARATGAARIATAHTADDQLETLLLRLARGTGLPGLGAMSARRGIWIRPLLEVPRAWIEADLTRVGQAWREDASNQDLRYARNRVRHRVVPALASVAVTPARPRRGAGASGGGESRSSEGLSRRVVRTLAEVREASRALDRVSGRIVARLCRIEGPQIRLDSRRLRSYPFAVQRNVLRRSWERLPGVHSGLTGQHLDLLLGLVARPRRDARAGLPDGRQARCEPGGLVLGPGVRTRPAVRHPKEHAGGRPRSRMARH